MAIPPELHHVRGLGVDTFIIAEDGRPLTLIDAGMPWSPWTIRRRIRAIGRKPEEIQRIICTHGHPDHVGGVPRLLGGRSDARAFMHPADIAGLAVGLRHALRRSDDGITRRSRLLDYFTPTPAKLEPILDGDVIPVLGGLRVIHTPGHTPGSVCLYAEQHRLLFTGDVLQVIRGRLTYANAFFSHEIGLARRTLSRLTELDVETIALAHYPAWRENANDALRRLAAEAVRVTRPVTG
jgi:glyoxylase-like metal-dependent hydrolase (beta-lactamase superfamily II)